MGGIRTGKKKKEKYKFTVMDYITIGFTAAVVLLMIFFLVRSLKPEWFTKKNKSGGSTNTVVTAAPTDNSGSVTPTEAPEYSGIGNGYGNMANGAVAAEIDSLTYFVRDDGQLAVKSESGGEARALTAGESGLTSVNVIKDPFAYTDIADSVAYLVTYINADGRICGITDGPYPDPNSDAELDSEPRAAEARTLAEGNYVSFTSVGQYFYAIDSDGLIWRIAIATGEKAALSSGRYSALCVYYGELFALGEGGVYRMALTPAAQSETDEGTDTASENEPIIAGQFTCFTVFDDWIYVGGESGLVRYDVDTLGKDSLSSTVRPVAVNVDKRGIFYAAGGELKLATAKELLTGSGRTLGTWDNAGTPRITLTSDNALVSITNTKVNEKILTFEI